MNQLPPETHPPFVPKPVSLLRMAIAAALLCLGIALHQIEDGFGAPELNWPRFFFALLIVCPVFIVGFVWLFVEGAILLTVLWKKHKADIWRKLKADIRTERGQCPGCGNKLSGNVSGICPECGKPVAQ